MRSVLLAALCLLSFVTTSAMAASAPSSGTLSPANPQLNYSAGPFTAANPSNQAGDPNCDLVPNSCDDFALTIDVDAAWLAAHPTGIVEILTTWPGPSDFDVYFQDASGATIDVGGANAGMPERILYKPTAGVTLYRVRTLAFAAVNESFNCAIRLFETPPVNTGAAIYATSLDVFTCNKHLEGAALAFDHGGDGEPAVAIQPDGVAWVGGIAGVGAGIGLWRFDASDACGQTPVFQNQPDAGVGGGDVDLVIAPEANALGYHNIYTSSLSLANVTSSTSLDGGATFALTPISTPSTVQDRQWNGAYGVNTLYLSFNIGATQPGQILKLYRSSGAGLAGTFVGPFLPRGTTDPTIPYGLGNLAVDRRPGGDELLLSAGPDGQGNVYQGYHQDGREVWVAVSRDFGTTWTQSRVVQLPEGNSPEHKFTWVAVDGGGNVYTCWADANNVYYSVSQDIKTSDTPTWSAPVRVNNGPNTKTCVLPMIEAGSAGRVIFGFYGTTAGNSQTAGAPWQYFHARCNNATDVVPVIEQIQVSDHVVHTGIVCLNGLGCACCRDLLECQELTVNPVDGSTFLTYAGAGGIHVTRQVAGESAIAGDFITDMSGPCPVLTDDPPCSSGPPPAESACILPGITVGTDPTGDVTVIGGPGQDIEHLWVAEPYLGPSVDELVFTMKVNAINPASLPPSTNWYILFTVTGATNPRKFVSMETCDVTQSPSFSYGYLDPTLGFQSEGSASGSVYSDGRIEIHIAKGLVGNPTPSMILGSIEGDVRVFVGAQCNGAVSRVDDAVGGDYVVVGNDYCTPQTVTCEPSTSASPGQDVPMTFLVNNPSTAARSFHVQLDDGNGWIVGGDVDATVGPVSPGSSGAVNVLVRMNSNCEPSTDLLSFSASASDLPAPNEESCTTTLTCEVGPTAVGPSEPTRFAFALAGSNPFQGSTSLRYAVPRRTEVKIEVFSIQGQRVRTLVNRTVEPGEYTTTLSTHQDGRRLTPGIYMLRMTAGDWSRGMRVIALD